ncbi:MAG TPA: C39 family peptidase [Candidatus Dormibacteraeota bacterium]|nr:C39 family peptidase [Candidatus Dormibacteraeota bacterium]
MGVLVRRGGIRPRRPVRWGGVVIAVMAALVLGSGSGVVARHYLNQREAPRPLAGVTKVHAQPIQSIEVGPGTMPTPTPLPEQVLLQVPFTTQAPLNNWAQHQESCEAATLTMLVSYWQHNSSVVLDPHAADASIRQIDAWKPQPDLNDVMMGDLAWQHFGYSYRLVPNDPKVIAEQLSAGRPLIAEVRTHALGNAHYPGYSSHYEQNGWSVPHFILIVGYDSTGVWLNDPGISWGRGYHISYAQLAHAIDSLDQHHPALNEGQVLLLLAPEKPVKARPGNL